MNLSDEHPVEWVALPASKPAADASRTLTGSFHISYRINRAFIRATAR